MMHHPRLARFLVFGALCALTALPTSVAGQPGPFRTAQLPGQTQEPPLFGQPTPAPKLQFPQQLQPVPVVPATFPPPQFQPSPIQPAPVFPAQPPAIVVPCPPIDPPPPVVTIKVRVIACSPAGLEIEYRICVENCSAVPAHHVLVRNPLPANARFVRADPAPSSQEPELLWAFGTLPPGCSKEICLVLAPTDDSDVKNCARVQFEHGQCVTTRIAKSPPGVYVPPTEKDPPKVITPKEKPKEPPKVVTPEDSKLTVKITGPAKQYANLPAKYQITVTNTADAAAPNVLVSALLPDKATPLDSSDNDRYQFGVVAWLIGDLPAGGSKTVQVTYRVPAAGEYCLKATASPETGGKAEGELCTDFEGVSALHLEAVDTKDPVEVGGATSYRITLVNQGTAPLTNIRVKALVPPEMATLRTTGPSPAPEKLPAPQADGQTIEFAPLKELKAGDRQVYEIFVNAVRPGDARFRVTLTADQLMAGGPVFEEESTQVFSQEDPSPLAFAAQVDPERFPVGAARHVSRGHRSTPFDLRSARVQRTVITSLQLVCWQVR